MIMLMMQSTITALVNALPSATPRDIVCQLNSVMRLNIRERLGAREHATFMMLRYHDDGRVSMAGAHEEVLIYRARERRCELLPTAGVWIGILPRIEQETVDRALRLEPGDILLLYTDGLIEARSAGGEALGIERVIQIVSANAAAPVQSMYDSLLAAVTAWTPVQQDDVTLVVMRRPLA